MSIVPDVRFYFDNPYVDLNVVYGQGGEFYSQAQLVRQSKNSIREGGRPASPRGGGAFGYGNFFPDMKALDQLVPFKGRGAGGHAVWIRFPSSPLWSHMSVFPSRTYKKAHRHGPGVVIVIPDGKGFSVMWPEGKERLVIPWHEASVFVRPDRWFHQHFNVSGLPSRYLAFPLPKGPECLQRKGGGQGKGPDRISQRRPVDQRKICRGTGEERTENPYARGGPIRIKISSGAMMRHKRLCDENRYSFTGQTRRTLRVYRAIDQ